MIRELRNLQEKHKNDQVFTFGTRWADVCRDVADRLEKLQDENAELRKRVGNCDDSRLSGILDSTTNTGKLTVDGIGYDVYMGEIVASPVRTHSRVRTLHKFSLIEI